MASKIARKSVLYLHLCCMDTFSIVFFFSFFKVILQKVMVDSVTHNEGEYTVLSMDRWAIKVMNMINRGL